MSGHMSKNLSTQLNNRRTRLYYATSVASLIALIVLCVAWELWLAPLRPGGSWMALKALPLLFPLRGILKRDIYTLQWSSMFILFYFTEGVVRAASVSGVDVGMGVVCASIEVGLTVLFFFATILFLKPYKQAAKQLALDTIQKAKL